MRFDLDGGRGPSLAVAQRTELRRGERILIGLESFTALCGLAGGAYLMLFRLSAMPMSDLDGTWFHSWFWPGVALAFFVGLCPLVVAIATWHRLKIARIGHIVVGLGLVLWILLEVAWIAVSPPLQILVAAVGIGILALGIRELRHDERIGGVRTRGGPAA